MRLEPLKEKWEAFGFYVEEIDGNDMREILYAFYKLEKVKDRPKLILADTVKGKGVSFMENQTKWHHGGLNDELYETASKEIAERTRRLCYE